MVREKIKIEGTPVIGEEPVTKLFEKIMKLESTSIKELMSLLHV
jgi:hypothetical protein